jgi:tetratricopeptide (TPR) repeat protein
MLVVFSCAQQPSGTVYIKNGVEYGKVKGTFRHRWWNYYERGLSYAEGEFYRQAVIDFEEALHQRDKDQRRARTYGMHFIDYFPHRELGIVHYFTGDLQSAQKQLGLSLSQFPSAKAQYYLDQVRKKIIQQEKKEILPPTLNLDLKNTHILTKADPVIISGTAKDDHYIRRIAVNKTPLFIKGSKKKFRFEKKLSLAQGRHFIEIEAENLIGKITKQQVIIVVDREGPVITIDKIELTPIPSGKQLFIGGLIYDEAGVSSLIINGRSVSLTPGTEVSFAEKLIINNKDELEFVAKDSLDNRTSAQMSLSLFEKADISAKIKLACADCDELPNWLAGIFGSGDARPPDIVVKGWTEFQTVFLKKVYIEGQVQDQNKIINLSLNDKSILRRKGNIIFFSQFVDLVEGENTLLIKAEDEKGNIAQKEISIFRRIPKALQLEERLRLTILPFEQNGVISETSNSFQDLLINALVNQNRFSIVERTALEVILEEQRLSRTKLFDEKTAIRLGKLIAAHAIIAGGIIKTRTGIEIIARVIDTETSSVLATADVFEEIVSLQTLNSLSEGLAVEFHREFPLLDGMVVKKKGNSIFTDLGENVIKLQRRLIVYRETSVKHPVTGKMLGSDNEILGRGRVIQVMPELSKAVLLDGKTAAIKPLDMVITE